MYTDHFYVMFISQTAQISTHGSKVTPKKQSVTPASSLKHWTLVNLLSWQKYISWSQEYPMFRQSRVDHANGFVHKAEILTCEC